MIYWVVVNFYVQKPKVNIPLYRQLIVTSVLRTAPFQVGEIAEKEEHHPDIWFGWGYAKIKIFTHAIKGLHESDFVLAAKVDRIS